MPSRIKGNKQSPAGLAKFSVPRSHSWVKRQRLFAILDNALRHPLTWIGAQAGAGKTALLASYLQEHTATVLWYNLEESDGDPATFFYNLRRLATALSPHRNPELPLLTPDYLPAIRTYAVNFFREFFRGLVNGGVVVLDNVQDVDAQDDFLQLIRFAVRETPFNVAIICLSRDVAPALFSRAMLNGDMVQINREDLKWTDDEIIAMARSMEVPVPSVEQLKVLQTQTDGWAAGLALLLHESSRSRLRQPLDNTTEQTLFDYFNLEIFQCFTSGEQQFMMKTAFLPEISEELAVELTGEPQATRLLDKLVRKNYFTVQLSAKPAAYRFHPLFRNFLLQQAHAILPVEAIVNIQTVAAELLAGQQNHSAAISLLIEARQWQLLADILCQVAQQYITQGRHQSLLEWLMAIPATVLAENTWLLYWKAAAMMPIELTQSHQLFATAFDRFHTLHNQQGMAMSWAGAVETIVHSMTHTERLDQWVEKLDILNQKFHLNTVTELQPLVAPQAVAICAIRGNLASQLDGWISLAEALLDAPFDPSQRILASFALITYFHWSGQPARSVPILKMQEVIIASGNATPLAEIVTKICKAWFSWIYGQSGQCRQAIEEGVEISRRTGVQHWTFLLIIQGITNALLHNDLQEAERLLSRLEPLYGHARDMDRIYYHNERGRLAFLKGHIEQALHEQLMAVEIARSLDAPFVIAETCFGLSQVYHAQDQLDLAEKYLAEVRFQGERYGAHQALDFECGLVESYYKLTAGDTASAANILAMTFAQAKRLGYCAFGWWRQEMIAQLCYFAFQHNIDPEFTGNLVRQFHVRPPKTVQGDELWPWPLRIHTLGHFSVQLHDTPMMFTGKAQKRPLELLKALIAFGGRNVTEETLSEALWPETEGDAAHSTFTTTLSRLRKLLGNDVLLFSDGKLTLNKSVCWVDVWVCERVLGQLERVGHKQGEAGDLDALLQRLLDLYHGPFLQGEGQGWILSLRERLKSRLLRTLNLLVQQEQDCSRTISLYEFALQIDDLSEQAYQGLMSCLGAQGRFAEALAVYGRCRNLVQAKFGIEPAEKTRLLAAAIQDGDKQMLGKSCPACLQHLK